MYNLKRIRFYYYNHPDLKAGVRGKILLKSDFYFSFTLYDKIVIWNDVANLEDQFTDEQIMIAEKEIRNKFEQVSSKVKVDSLLLLKW